MLFPSSDKYPYVSGSQNETPFGDIIIDVLSAHFKIPVTTEDLNFKMNLNCILHSILFGT